MRVAQKNAADIKAINKSLEEIRRILKSHDRKIAFCIGFLLNKLDATALKEVIDWVFA